MDPKRGQCEGQEVSTVEEKDLIRYCSVNAVKQLRLEAVPCEDDKTAYRVHVKGTWDAQEHLLITFRKSPREWSSLDRFMRHARDVYRFRGRLVLDMKFDYENKSR